MTRRIVAVVVSYNRRDLLREALSAVTLQDPPCEVVVVDNASTDGSVTMVEKEFPSVDLVALHHNTGGAGGFALGVALALGKAPDLLWLLDDDAVPEPDALSALVDAYERYPGDARPAGVASRVVWVDGRTHRMNVPRRRRGASPSERRTAASVDCAPIRTASFCSLLVDAHAARAEALPVADYYLWNDDFEYTARLLRRRIGLLCPASVVVHKTATYYNSGSPTADRFFYDVRNMVWMLGRSRGLSPIERAFFTTVTLRRWIRTLYRSRDRRGLTIAMARALAAGIARGPRPTAQVLARTGVL